jgi:alkanesulfonate monooxygenase SsuD/methylene tetrahydromethanopterin reductase-like flavin-dependent oxidoreductase (luciferase family)
MYAIRYAATELIKTAASEEGAERLRQMAQTPYEDILRQRVMYGTPEEVTERLQAYRDELDISGVVLEMNYGGQVADDRVMNSVRLLTEKVIPNFK